MVYEVTAEEEKKNRFLGTIEKGDTDGKAREAEGGEARDRGKERAEGFGAYGAGEVPGGALGLDGETHSRRGLPRVGGGVAFIEPMAGAGDGRDALGVGASGCGASGGGVKPASCGIVGT